MKLPLKRGSFLNDFLLKIKVEFYNLICQDIKRKSQKLFQKEKKYCIYDEQEQRIKEKVKERRKKAENFDRVKEVAPIIKREIEQKRSLEDILTETKDIIFTLYLAYLLKDDKKIRECFDRLKGIGILDDSKLERK